MNAQPNWDDLRVFLAAARHGSLSRTARALNINHSTVLRRIGTLEAALGARLFDRLPSGYALSAAGEELRAAATRIEEEVASVERHLAGRDAQPSGAIRVTTIDILALYVLPRHLAAFRAAYRNIRLEIVVAETPFSLTRREADVAIRATSRPPEPLIGRAVSGLALAIYGTKDVIERNGDSVDPTNRDWIGFDESFAHLDMARWLERNVPADRIGYRANSVAVLCEAAKAGLGLALLPCGLGDAEPCLTRVVPPIPELASQIWLLTHEDLRRSGRIRIFLDFMAEAFRRDRDLLEGHRHLART